MNLTQFTSIQYLSQHTTYDLVVYTCNYELKKKFLSALSNSYKISIKAFFENFEKLDQQMQLTKPNLVLIDQFLISNSLKLLSIIAAYPKITFISFQTNAHKIDKLICKSELYKNEELLEMKVSLVKDLNDLMTDELLHEMNSIPFSSKIVKLHKQELSFKEVEVLQSLSKGKSIKMVAEDLRLSTNTIKTYLKRAYTKLNAHSVTEAIFKFNNCV